MTKIILFILPNEKNMAKFLLTLVIAIELLKDTNGRKWVTKGIGKIVKNELKQLCSDNTNSIQASKDPAVLADFPWTQIVEEGTCMI